MGNTLALYIPILKGLMKIVGVRPQELEIDPGTVMNFWAPTKTNKNQTKPSVVFLHGFGFNGILTWQFQVLSLARSYGVYVPDFLFFGSSITHRKDRSPAFQAECVAKGLRKLGVDKCTLVCNSYGGMVGFKMAEMYPDLVDSMVVSCSVMALTESVSRAGLDRIGFSSWADYLLPTSVGDWKQTLDIATYKFPWIPDFVHRDTLEVMFDHRKERTELLEALVTSDKDFNIPNFQQRIHLLWGDHDRIFDMDVARKLQEQLEGNATLDSIEKAGHLVHLERPWVYNQHLKKILTSLHEERPRKPNQ